MLTETPTPGALAPAPPRLTREQIDAMDADALRVAVAEALGWTEVVVWGGDPAVTGRDSAGLTPWPGDTQSVPNYSGDIAAAWQVIEGMSRRGYAYKIHETHPQGGVHVAAFGDQSAVYTYRGGKSPAVAICRACLTALFCPDT